MMKKLSFLFFLIPACNYLFAQNQQPFKYNWKNVKQLLGKSNKSVFLAFDSLLVNKTVADTARLTGVTKNATIYALPQDKTACLKPDNTYAGQLPVKKFEYGNGLIIKQKGRLPAPLALQPSRSVVQQMPNAYRGNAIVFEKVN